MTSPKERVVQAALELVPAQGVIGLGSGSTAELFVHALAKHDHSKLACVPSSRATAELAASLGITLLDEAGPWSIDVAFDGADEVDDDLELIKGGGGCLTREKIVIAAANETVIFVDDTKLSKRLGEKWHVPVEVTSFGHASVAASLAKFGTPTLRQKNGAPFVTDQGGYIYDVKTGPITDPRDLERRLEAVVGVLCAGIFSGSTTHLLIGRTSGVERRSRR